MRRSRLFPLVIATLLALTAAACGGSDGSDDADSRKGTTTAKSGDLASQKLVLYSGRDEELIAPIVEAFEQKTGVDVEVRYGSSSEMAAQILEEGDATPADLFYSQEVGAVGALAKAGLLSELPSDVVESVDERFRPKGDRLWVGVTGRSRVIVHNPDKLAELGLPTPSGVADLTDPRYKGHVAIVPGNAGFKAFITAFRVSEGEDAARQWIEDMKANDVDASFESNGDVLEAVNNGDIAIGLINHYYWARHENRDGLAAQLVFPKGDDPGGLVNATAVGITAKGAENPAALALVRYLISAEGQNTFVQETWEYPVIDGVADPQGIPALDELEGPPIDLADLDSLEATEAMLTDLALLE
jgi:iron(III) transport system substrate-binding protein